MCDGQRTEMQNYLREQKGGIHMVNIVKELVDFLFEYTRSNNPKKNGFTKEMLKLLTEVFQTLIELCTGNYNNIRTIFRNQIVSIINYYLQIEITDKDTGVIVEKLSSMPLYIDVLKLKEVVVGLLEAMFEETSKEATKLTHNVASRLEIKPLLFSLSDFYVLKDDKQVKENEVDDNARRALFKAYSIIMKHNAVSESQGILMTKLCPLY